MGLTILMYFLGFRVVRFWISCFQMVTVAMQGCENEIVSYQVDISLYGFRQNVIR